MHDDVRSPRRRSVLAPITGAVLLAAAASLAGTGAPGDDGVVPPSPTLGMKPPALDDRTTVLFDGKTWSGWHRRDGAPSGWTVQDDGSVLVKAGDGDAIGLAVRSWPLRLRRSVKNSRPLSSMTLKRTVRNEGRPAASTVARLIAFMLRRPLAFARA